MSMAMALESGYIERALNSLEVVQLTMPDFCPLNYPVFYTNVIITHNLNTLIDLKKETTRYSSELHHLSQPSVLADIAEDTTYICKMWNDTK